MPISIDKIEAVNLVKGTKWRSTKGEIAVIIKRWRDLDSGEVSSFDVYLWNQSTFINIDADTFYNAITKNNYTPIK